LAPSNWLRSLYRKVMQKETRESTARIMSRGGVVIFRASAALLAKLPRVLPYWQNCQGAALLAKLPGGGLIAIALACPLHLPQAGKIEMHPRHQQVVDNGAIHHQTPGCGCLLRVSIKGYGPDRICVPS
jgi:hypothetical protein